MGVRLVRPNLNPRLATMCMCMCTSRRLPLPCWYFLMLSHYYLILRSMIPTIASDFATTDSNPSSKMSTGFAFVSKPAIIRHMWLPRTYLCQCVSKIKPYGWVGCNIYLFFKFWMLFAFISKPAIIFIMLLHLMPFCQCVWTIKTYGWVRNAVYHVFHSNPFLFKLCFLFKVCFSS